MRSGSARRLLHSSSGLRRRVGAAADRVHNRSASRRSRSRTTWSGSRSTRRSRRARSSRTAARTARPVAGTIARGHLKDDDVYYTRHGRFRVHCRQNPEKIDMETAGPGQARFNIYCSPCHDRVGSGQGIVAIKTPAWQPTNLQDDRIKKMADGEIFSVISHGRRTMPAYRFQVVEHDRWAIVAYLRALQRSTSGTVADVPADLKAELH